jgi:hypothetical protein
MHRITHCPPGYAWGYVHDESYGDRLNETIHEDGRMSADVDDKFVYVRDKYRRGRIINTTMTRKKIADGLFRKTP